MRTDPIPDAYAVRQPCITVEYRIPLTSICEDHESS